MENGVCLALFFGHFKVILVILEVQGYLIIFWTIRSIWVILGIPRVFWRFIGILIFGHFGVLRDIWIIWAFQSFKGHFGHF